MELHPMHFETSSSSMDSKQAIVSVKGGNKYYGSKKNPVVVLEGLNMRVSKGTIFGLLGSSGCGKTTLLSCILGRKKLNSGEIKVFGEQPGTKHADLLASRIGYMPQETAMYGDFTIRETLVYFGWIAGMTNKEIEARSSILTKLLMLPDCNQRVNTLSGGEQRRLSLASALLHGPELLILDEPTVGVDPLLRETIWNYLVHISSEENTTVIITTHYIEEAGQAHIIGLMRGGELLAEEAPRALVSKYGTKTLEEVFLKLSIVQDSNHQESVDKENEASLHSIEELVYNSGSTELCITPNKNEPERNKNINFKVVDYLPVFKRNHLKALIWKNMMWWMRNFPALIFMVVLPGLIIALFCMAIGQNPHDLTVAVVNYETNNTDDCNNTLICNGSQLSCNYLEHLKKYSLIVVYYSSEADAVGSVLSGETHASIILKENYSMALQARIDDWVRSKPWDIESSSIDVVRDVSNVQIANFLKIHMYDAFSNLLQDYLSSCEASANALKVPINLKSPVYGVKYPSFTDFSMPGVLLTVTFILTVLLTSYAMLIERNEGNLERTFVIGISELELITSHIACEFIIMAIQIVSALTFGFGIFEMTQRGSFILVVLLLLLAGMCGMCYGVFIACICESDTAVNALATGTFFPMIMLGGVVWPIEGMHYLLRPFAYCLPLTQAVEGLRSILQKNWDISSETVYMGYVCMVIWIIIFLVVSVLYLKLKKH